MVAPRTSPPSPRRAARARGGRVAVSRRRAASFSGPDGSGRGFSGGVDARGAAKSHFSNGGAASDGFVYRDTTAGGGNQTLQGQHRAVSGSLGHVSMHKNGPTAAARAVVEDGGDESEEDGEEGVSPAFVPEDSAAGEESPADVDM